MGFKLTDVVPWGRSYDEYKRMFLLSQEDLEKTILGCGDGPASFNAVMTRNKRKVTSIDPIYQFSKEEIERRIHETFETVIEQARNNQGNFKWDTIRSVKELGAIRMRAMNEFLSDYPNGLQEGRYRCEQFPSLSFIDQEFELALCSHFLFLYSEQLSEQFHIESIKELCRVAKETRIFPLLDLDAKKSKHLSTVLPRIESEGYIFDIRQVPYEFQKGGNEMLVVRSFNNR